MAKMWKGRFSAATHPLLETFSESLSFDRELAQVDIRGSCAHARMLAHVGLLTAKERDAILKGLDDIRQDIETGRFEYRAADEDIHMAIEGELTRRIGEPAKKLHTARSRNDQVATDMRLWCREAVDTLDTGLKTLQRRLLAKAREYRDTVVPGFTHLQRAQPVLLAQHLLAYVEMFGRDRERLADARARINRMPLGSCALAGTTLPIDRTFTMKALGFEALCMNSMDAVGDRDFCVELVAALALVMAHISRLSEDVILWSSSEWGLVTLADEWSTGSSIMPQKRNPDVCELARGKSGRVYGALMALLTLIKGLPMTYNRDLQEDKPQVFDAVRTAGITVTTLAGFVPSLAFNSDAARRMLTGGFLDATVVAEYLVEKGLPFRSAHEVSGRLVRLCEDRGGALSELSLEDFVAESPLFEPDIFKRLDPERVVKAYCSAGSAGTREVAKSLARWTRLLK